VEFWEVYLSVGSLWKGTAAAGWEKKDGPVSGNFKSPNVLRGSLGLFPGEWERTDERSRKRSYFGRKEKEEIQLL